MGDQKDGDFVTWLAANMENVRNGAGSFEGMRVTGESLTARYFTCVSFIVITQRQTSTFFLQGTDAERSTAITATLLTLLLVWWGIPFGIIFTPIYLIKNLTGGDKCTVTELMKVLENPAELKKVKDNFQYAPLKVMLGAFACIVALMVAMQCYVSVNRVAHKGATNYSHGREKQAPRNPQSAVETAPAPNDPVMAYMRYIERSLKSSWYPPKSNESSRVVVRFDIDAEGKANKVRVFKSSNNKEMDAAAVKAVHASEPYPPLPAVLKGVANIEFTFDYNVWDQQHRKVPAADSDTNTDKN